MLVMLDFFIFFCSIVYNCHGQGPSMCDTVHYSVRNGSDNNMSCEPTGACNSYDCKLTTSVTSINFTFTCFNITRTEFILQDNVESYSGTVIFHINNESEVFNISSNEQPTVINRSYWCATALQLTFPTAIGIHTIRFISAAPMTEMTTSMIMTLVTSDKDKPTSTPTGTPTGTSNSTSTGTPTGTPTGTSDNIPNSTLNGTPDAMTTQESTSAITSAITGASIAIGLLLLLVVLAIMILIGVLVKKRKSNILDPSEITSTENNYSVVNTQPTLTPPSNYEVPYFERNNSNVDVRVITERNPQDLSEQSLPVPPLEPELIPLEVWKRENDNLPLYNPHYASTAVSNSNLSEPPDYESIQEVKQNYILLSGGNLDPHSGLQQEFNKTSCVGPMDRGRAKREVIGVNKMTLLPEEDSYFGEESLMLTAENCIYESEVAGFGYTAENSLYQSEQDASGPNPSAVSHINGSKIQNFLYGSDEDISLSPAGGGAVSSGELAIHVDQNVNNDLYEVSKVKSKSNLHDNSLARISSPSAGANPREHTLSSPSLTQTGDPLDEQNTLCSTHGKENSPRQGLNHEDGEQQAVSAPKSKPKIPAYSEINFIEKRRRRKMASDKSKKEDNPSCIDSDSDDIDNPPYMSPYHPDHDSMGNPPRIPPYHPGTEGMDAPPRIPSYHPDTDSGDDEYSRDPSDQDDEHKGDGKELPFNTEMDHGEHSTPPLCGEYSTSVVEGEMGQDVC